MMSKPQRVGLIVESSSSETSQQNRTQLMLPMSPGGKALSLLELGMMKELNQYARDALVFLL